MGVDVAESEATATSWADRPVFCRNCGGPTDYLGDNYGSLAAGGSFEQFLCRECSTVTRVELPD